MRRGLIIIFALFSCVWASAQTDSLFVADTLAVADTSEAAPLTLFEMEQLADTTSVIDTLEMSDEDIMKMLATPQADTVVKVVDKGHNVSRYINASRQRSLDYTPFSARPMSANMFASARVTSMKLISQDYSAGIMLGASVGKWLHEDHAVRLDLSMGTWNDLYDGIGIMGAEATASYLFNLISYVGGYRTNRLAEVYIVAGGGYANSIHSKKLHNAIKGHVGLQLNLRLFKDFDLYFEPLAAIYSNGMAVSYNGNWKWWMSAFQANFGLTYNIHRSMAPDSPNLLPRTDGWFVSLTGGPHIQNSSFVLKNMTLDEALGVHVSLGVGKYYTDFFSIRYSAAYSRGSWIKYDDETYPCNYFAARAEVIVDMYKLIGRAAGYDKVEDTRLSLNLLAGPEFGYMYKVDAESDIKGHVPVISSAYVGLTGGVQAKVRLARRLSLYFEPRFSIVPYDAPNLGLVGLNKYLNYYDGIFNANFGIEFLL